MARFLSVVPGVIFFAGLALLRAWVKVRQPKGPPPPADAIIFWSHTQIYIQQIDPAFLPGSPYRMPVIVGNRSFLSYLWHPWQIARGYLIYRPDLRAEQKPFHQIAEFLKLNRNQRVGIMTDSGGPYGRVRPSLIGLSIQSGRPLVAVRSVASRSLVFKGHQLPLPFAEIWAEFSSPISAEDLRKVRDAEALALVQRSFENPLER